MKVVTSAVVVIPPQSEWDQIQQIRAIHDKAYERWMPHINLLYPFVPEDQFDSNFERTVEKLKDLKPFQLNFNHFENFSHARSFTVFLKPTTDPPNALIELQSNLFSLFPSCDDLSTRSENGFAPHLTVGQFIGKVQLERNLTKFNSSLKPISFTVSEVYFISRKNDEPFQIIKTIPLGYTGDNSSLRNITNQLSTLSLNEAEHPEPEPVAPARDPFQYSDDQVPLLKFRVLDWLRAQQDRNKLPKSRGKLKSCIAKLCIVPHQAASGERLLEVLRSESIVTTGPKGAPQYNKEPLQHLGGASKPVDVRFGGTEEISEGYCVERAKKWLKGEKNPPLTEGALRNRLAQLGLVNRRVNEEEIISNLEWEGYLECVGFDELNYHLWSPLQPKH
eukprot:TRINITY_DN3354_c0_g1_i1.p1 TRINITY_DN3354_c0_g1~~TRINITY_DN3354_c0_g1_i1.p1  ORF type:complete len:391 (-),score=86.71 TRINITY_DN3354_c0_g1_i1:161-1333(-)